MLYVIRVIVRTSDLDVFEQFLLEKYSCSWAITTSNDTGTEMLIEVDRINDIFDIARDSVTYGLLVKSA